jgi:hypothetical protein
MAVKIRFIFLILALQLGSISFGQFLVGAGYELGFIQTEEVYNLNVLVYNDNETYDFYSVQSQLGAVSHGVMGRSFGGQFLNPKKLTLGYSLELGYQYFTSKGKFFYRESSTTYADSIVNFFDGFTYQSNYHMVRFDHYLDLHWNPSSTIKISNSIGAGLTALVRGASPALEIDGTMINTNHPIIKFKYQPQITEQYKGFAMTFFASIDLFAFELFTNQTEHETPDYRIPLNKLRFNTIGIRFVPDPKKPKEKPTEEFY